MVFSFSRDVCIQVYHDCYSEEFKAICAYSSPCKFRNVGLISHISGRGIQFHKDLVQPPADCRTNLTFREGSVSISRLLDFK